MELKHILSTLKYNKFIAFIVIFQVALSLSVVSNSLFLALKTYNEWSLPSGFKNDEVVMVTSNTYRDDVNYQQAHVDDMIALVEIESVESITPMDRMPIAAGWPNEVYLGTGDDKQSFQTHIFDFDHNGVEVMGLTIIEGRNFTQADVVYGDAQGQAAVILLSEAMAETLFSGESALDKTVWLEADASPAKVIGIYSNFLSSQFLAEKGKPYQGILRPRVEWSIGNSQSYMMKVQPGTAETVKNTVEEYFSKSHGRYSYEPETFNDLKTRAFQERLSTMNMFLTVSLMLIIITFCGLLGLISFLTSTRTRQIGIRRALGANKGTILKEFVLENLLVSIAGVGLGLLFTLIISSQFYEFNGMDAKDLVFVVPVSIAILILNVVAVSIPVKKSLRETPSSVIG